MKLQTKLLLATTATSLIVLGLSEWLSYEETMRFFDAHVTEMNRASSASGSTAALETNMAALGGRLIWIHLGHAALEVLALVVVLNFFWSRLVLAPIGKILSQMNRMGHSVTCRELPVGRADEIGQMGSELNRLGGKLSTALEHAASASELAAMALMGRTLLLKVSTARDQLAPALRSVAQAQRDAVAPPESAVLSLEAVLERLSNLSDLFEEEFEKRLDERRRQTAGTPVLDAVSSSSGATAAQS